MSRGHLYLVVMLGSSVVASAAAAQSAPSPASGGADNVESAQMHTGPAIPEQDPRDIVVTASKRPERVSDVAMGITALDGAELNRRQSLGFEDYAALVPGLSLQQQGNGFTRLVLRGLNAGTSGSTVGVYIDESPIGSSNGLVRGGLLTANISSWDLQRVEVLRGPQGTLYGASTQAGLLKFVVNRPDPDNLSGEVEAGAVTVAHGETDGSIKGVVNLPIAAGLAAVRVSGYYEGLPGYIDDPLRGESNANGGRRTGVRGSLLVKPAESLDLQLTGFWQRITSGATPTLDAVGSSLTFATPPSDRYAPAIGYAQERYAAERSANDILNFDATINWRPGATSIKSITSYGIIRQRRTQDYTSAVIGPGFTYGDVLTNFFFGGSPAGLAAADFLRVRKFSQEIRIASTNPGFFQWQLGGFYTHEAGYVRDDYYGFAISTSQPLAGTSFGTQDLPSSYREYAAFGEATFTFSKQFDIAMGGRFSHNDQHSTTRGTASPLLGPALDIPADSSGDAFTYSIAPRFHLGRDTLLYARIASGFRPGGPNVVPPGAPAGIPLTYGPDRTTNYEVGFRSSLFDKMLSVDIAAFYIDWKDIQLVEVVNNQNVTANGGAARSKGVEWNFTLRPVSGLTLSLLGAYVDAKVTQDSPDAGALKGQQLPYSPDLSGTLDGEYRWRTGASTEAFFGLTASYVGVRYADFGAAALYEPHARLPVYTTLGLRAGMEFGRYEVELYGKNVTDTRGITAYSNTGTPFLRGSIGIVQPATVGILARAHF